MNWPLMLKTFSTAAHAKGKNWDTFGLCMV